MTSYALTVPTVTLPGGKTKEGEDRESKLGSSTLTNVVKGIDPSDWSSGDEAIQDFKKELIATIKSFGVDDEVQDLKEKIKKLKEANRGATARRLGRAVDVLASLPKIDDDSKKSKVLQWLQGMARVQSILRRKRITKEETKQFMSKVWHINNRLKQLRDQQHPELSDKGLYAPSIRKYYQMDDGSYVSSGEELNPPSCPPAPVRVSDVTLDATGTRSKMVSNYNAKKRQEVDRCDPPRDLGQLRWLTGDAISTLLDADALDSITKYSKARLGDEKLKSIAKKEREVQIAEGQVDKTARDTKEEHIAYLKSMKGNMNWNKTNMFGASNIKKEHEHEVVAVSPVPSLVRMTATSATPISIGSSSSSTSSP